MKKLIFLFILTISQLVHAKAIEVQKPKIYHGYEDIKGWYMSEKLDGIRGYWDGKQLVSKNGNKIHAPKWFIKNFPPFALDGELWSKRGDFENIQSIVLDDKPSKKWKEISYQIFEVPYHEGNFTQRLLYANKWLNEKQIEHAHTIKQIKCKSREHLKKYLHYIENLGGEGIVVKNPKLPYFTGRSAEILKVKSFKDMEGKVIGINSGKGKFQGLMGSLTLKLEDGVIFRLGGGFNLQDRKNPPKIGSLVTFKYYGVTKNSKPKFASFMRVREIE
jgi:DNA ligase-1